MPTFAALHEALRAQGLRRSGNSFRSDSDRRLRLAVRHGDEFTGHEFGLRYEPGPLAPQGAPEWDLWFHFTEPEQAALMRLQREVLLRHRHRSPGLTDLRLEGTVDDVSTVAAQFVFYDDAEREEWARRLVVPVIDALPRIWPRPGPG